MRIRSFALTAALACGLATPVAALSISEDDNFNFQFAAMLVKEMTPTTSPLEFHVGPSDDKAAGDLCITIPVPGGDKKLYCIAGSPKECKISFIQSFYSKSNMGAREKYSFDFKELNIGYYRNVTLRQFLNNHHIKTHGEAHEAWKKGMYLSGMVRLGAGDDYNGLEISGGNRLVCRQDLASKFAEEKPEQCTNRTLLGGMNPDITPERVKAALLRFVAKYKCGKEGL